MRAILLSTLLMSILLLTSGCEEIDKDDLTADVYTSVVYVTDDLIDSGDLVNIDITVNGEQEHLRAYERPLTFTQTGENDEMDIFYTKSDTDESLGSETLVNSGTYIYAATECSFKREHLLDTVTDRNTIRFMNLTVSDIRATELTIKKDNVFIGSIPNASSCSVTTMPYLLSTNGTWVVTYADVEIGRLIITNDAPVAIIFHDTVDKIAKVIKVETYDDLIPLCDES